MPQLSNLQKMIRSERHGSAITRTRVSQTVAWALVSVVLNGSLVLAQTVSPPTGFQPKSPQSGGTNEPPANLAESLLPEKIQKFIDTAPSAPRPGWATNLPKAWDNGVIGIPIWQWVALLVMIASVLVIYRILKAVIKKLLNVSAFGVPLSDRVKGNLYKAGALVGSAGIAFLEIDEVGLVGRGAKLALGFLQCVTIASVVFLIIALWDAIAESKIVQKAGTSLGNRTENLLVPVATKFVRFLVIAGGLLAALGVFGVNVYGLVAGLGIGGLVVALAAKDSVENVFGSITILFDMPFAIGDWVKIDQKTEGVVEEINLRSTRLRTFEDSVITVPNSLLIKATVENMGARRHRRQRFFVKVGHEAPPQAVNGFTADLKAFVLEIEGVDPERVLVLVHEFDEFSLNVLVQCFVDVPPETTEFEIKHNIMLEADQLRAKWELPMPTIR